MSPSRRRTLAALALVPSLGLNWRLASARTDNWPTKHLRIVVPSTAGSSLDALARTYARHLGESLKQSVVVENRPGANQTIGIAAIQSTPADGYSLLFTSTELVRVPLLYPKLRYDPFSEFVALSQAAATATYLCVPTSLQVNNLNEFIEHARRAQQPVSVGSPGHGSGAHFYSELLAQAADIKLSHVAYRGEVPLVPDLLTQRVESGWLSGNLVNQYVAEGKIKVLGVGSVKQRVSSMPAIPTFSEQGIPGLDIEGFIGMFALAGTPAPIVDRLSTELGKIRAYPDVREQLQAFGFEAGTATNHTEFEAVLRATHEGWVRAIDKANIQMDA